MNSPFGTTAPTDGHAHQFRLARLQTFNWGTFSGVFDFPVPAEGYLFVGPSGSGKSTLLDAHAALLTPPKWVAFNVAAREGERKSEDRNLMTYLRGAWSQQSGQGREVITQMLRADTTWSALAETYRNGEGRAVTLALLSWVRGKSTARDDVKRLYLVLPDELDVASLEFFPRSDFDVRRFKHELSQAFVTAEFSAYQERFRSLLGIGSERALRLLHKTQSAKNMGDLDAFLRDFMLDAPETFDVADRLVLEFGELNAAHQAVVTARRQIETLAPAHEAFMQRESCAAEKNVLAEVMAGADLYREQWRGKLMQERIGTLRTDADGSKQKTELLQQAAAREDDKLRDLKDRRANNGGRVIEDLERQRDEAEHAKPERLRKRQLAQEACQAMGWTLPSDVVAFVKRVDAAREQVRRAGERSQKTEAHKDALKRKKEQVEQAFTETVREVRAMQRQRSNIPSRLLELRADIARELGLAEERLPFAGELLQVRANEAPWQGAIERVLGGFARSLLVEDKHYAAVSTYLEEHHTGERLFYNRVRPQQAGQRAAGLNSLVRKLEVAPGPLAEWLGEELKVHFDFECAETMQAFRAAPRAVTRQGQIKRDSTRHEKNDRQRIDDRSQWALGFDNRDKLRLYEQRAADLGAQISQLDEQLQQARGDEERQRGQDMACNTLQNLSWNDVDVASLVTLVNELAKRIDAELAARPDLAALDRLITKQEKVHVQATQALNEEQARAIAIASEIARLTQRMDSVDPRMQVALTPTQREGLDARLTGAANLLTLDSLDATLAKMDKALAAEDKAIELRLTELRHAIEYHFADFNREWPAESGGLDATLAAGEDYFAKLMRLRTDGLPKYEQRFMQLLREQSDQNLTLLSSKLEQERSAIRTRMELVNESLHTAPFNKDTHLCIDTLDQTPRPVQEFRDSLRHALSHSYSADGEGAEQRFAALQALVKRLASQEHEDRRWRDLVLDVRQHVSFMARELEDITEREVEVYVSGAGKSGGQRQKLTATCLAAALRYQLGGQDQAWPAFATVMMDEAFDKADAEFTAIAVNIFNTFGFQMVVATPMKSVMTLEPFIGGACVVHNADRKTSTVLRIDYEHAQRRLALPGHLREVVNAEAAAAP
jgi:uncharacterized protein YPO0396